MLRNTAELTSVFNRAHRTVSILSHEDVGSTEVQSAIQGALDALEQLDQAAERAKIVRDIGLAESRVKRLKRQLSFHDTGVIPIEEDEVEMT